MTDPSLFLKSLAAVLGAAAVITVIFQRLRLPLVLGYLLAGLLISPAVPVPIFAEQAIVQTLAELGVIFLMFCLGLELRLRDLLRLAGSAGLVALIEMSLLFWLGYLAGRVLGWGPTGALFTGGVVAVSSTMIIARTLATVPVPPGFSDRVFGVLVFEDLGAVLLLAGLGGLGAMGGRASGEGADHGGGGLGGTVLRLLGFLLGAIIIGQILIPRVVRATVRLGSPETQLIVAAGLCCGGALLAHSLGFSVALGAFLAGLLAAESGEGARVEHLLRPLRDLFAAIFFVSVGMLIQPRAVLANVGAIALLSAVVVLGKICGVSLASFLLGSGVRTALLTGFTFAQIGEFSFIIAGLAQAQGLSALYPTAVAVSVVTAGLSPLLVRAAGPVAAFIDRRLPPALATFVTLYGTWIERLRSAPAATPSLKRRLMRRLLLDASCLIALFIATAQLHLDAVAWLQGRGLSYFIAGAVVIGAALLAALPFLVGLVRSVQRLGALLATQAIPAVPEGALDLGRSPRQALAASMQLLILLLLGLPFLAVTQPFLERSPILLAVTLLLALVSLSLWLLTTLLRRSADLAGHVRAGAQVLLEAYGAMKPQPEEEPAQTPEVSQVLPLPGVLPEGGAPTTITLPQDSSAIGRSLAQLDLRGLTGATALVLRRRGEAPVVPTPREPLRAGDKLVLVGTAEALAGARQLLGVPEALLPPQGG